MSLSVILPNYNHGAFIARALRAMAEQDPAPDEIVVVDDGSTDDSVKIIEDLQKRHKSIRLLRHETNQGPVAAMMTAHKVVSGEYVLTAAADDFVFPGFFGRAIAALDGSKEAAFYCCEVVIIGAAGTVYGVRPIMLPKFTAGYMSPADVRKEFRSSDNWFVGTSVVHRRSRLAEIGHFDFSLGSLTDSMANRLLAYRYGFFFDPVIGAACSVYPDSFSARAALSPEESKRLALTARDWIKDRFPPDVRDWYGPLFDRRLRFNLARLRLVWNEGSIDPDTISDGVGLKTLDHAMIRLLARLPFLRAKAILAWMTLRLYPYRWSALIAAGWRNLTVNPGRLAALAGFLATMSGSRG